MADLAQVEPAVIEAQNGLTLSSVCMIEQYYSTYVPVLVEQYGTLEEGLT